LGSSIEVPFSARLIAATNQDLERLVRAGRFREDLFFRVQVVHVEVPPLRCGEYFLDAIVTGPKGIAGFGSCPFRVASEAGVESVTVQEAFVEVGGEVHGEIKLRGDSAIEQRLRLEAEGVRFRGRKVYMKAHEWAGRGAVISSNR
jgi:hypothetical protein